MNCICSTYYIFIKLHILHQYTIIQKCEIHTHLQKILHKLTVLYLLRIETTCSVSYFVECGRKCKSRCITNLTRNTAAAKIILSENIPNA